MSGHFTLSEDQLKKTYEAFTRGDEDADGKISWKEFSRMSREFQLGLQENQIREIFKNADNDRSGYLNFAEFLTTYFSIADKSRVKASPIPSIAALDDDKLTEVRTYFYNKKSNKGKVTRMECLSMLRDMGIRMNNDEISFLFKLADEDNDSMISYGEFKMLAKKKASSNKSKLQQENLILRERFLQYDGDGDGKLNRLEFQELLNYLQIPVDKRSLGKVFRDVDASRSGDISWEEFYNVYQKVQSTPGAPGWTATIPADSPQSSYHSSSRSSSDKSEKISRKDVIRTCNYFWSADKNGDGLLSRSEFGNMVQALKLNMAEEDIDKAFKKSDKGHTEMISFAEFATTFLNKKSKHHLSHEEVKQTFLDADKGKKGYLDVSEATKALKMLGCSQDEALLTSILRNIDDDHDGKISLREFCVFLDIGE